VAVQQIKDQYKNSRNLESRISIYQYAVNPETLPKWLVRKITPGTKLNILELGCGTGSLWTELEQSFPGCKIILSDLSDGMLEKSKSLLGSNKYEFMNIDYHNIPFTDSEFDIVISNHNLYHAENLDKVISEIHRVLKPGGKLYATTNSDDHLHEVRSFINTEEWLWPNSLITAAFGTESGHQALSKYFTETNIELYQNELQVTNFDAIKKYLLSVRDDRIHSIVNNAGNSLKEKFEKELEKNRTFKIRTKVTLFVCEK
jgi:ubiquinone/menaquinone biosynthesis C-methylase UbiE